MKLYNVTGTVNPKYLTKKDYGLSVQDVAGDEREIDLCWGNVNQGCWIYVRAQLAAYNAHGAICMVEKHIWNVLKIDQSVSMSDVDLDAEEIVAEWDFGV